MPPEQTSVRIDRWLWAARIFKTRSMAKAAIEGGKVHLNGQRTKPAKEISPQAVLTVNKGQFTMTLVVDALSAQRGPASVAQTLYHETVESIELRESLMSKRRMERAGLSMPAERPSKKDRRDLRKLKTLDQQWQSES